MQRTGSLQGDHQKSPDVATVLTEIDGKNVYICSAYLDGTNNIDTDTDNILPKKLMELLKHVRETNKELILCTDSNSHSTMVLTSNR